MAPKELKSRNVILSYLKAADENVEGAARAGHQVGVDLLREDQIHDQLKRRTRSVSRFG